MSTPLAVLSDIHANLWALEAVLAHAKTQGASAFLNLGDILYGPLKPRGVFDRLLQENVIATVQGNQDRLIYDATPQDFAANPTLAFVVKDLGEDPVHWLRGLPKTAIFHHDIFLCHGSPSSDVTYLLEEVATGLPVARCAAAVKELLGGVSQPVVLCGHTHIPRLVRLSGGQLVVNPGSVGLPAYEDELPVPHRMEMHAPHASYAILERGSRGWDVAIHRVAYDHEAAAACAAALGRRDWARGIGTGWT